jgi:hypothetical protein
MTIKRYALSGEIIEDETGQLIEYKDCLRLLEYAMKRQNEHIGQIIADRNKTQEEIIEYWKGRLILQGDGMNAFLEASEKNAIFWKDETTLETARANNWRNSFFGLISLILLFTFLTFGI